jgi:hypothetical protein
MASLIDGVGGDRSAAIVARIPANITAGAKAVVIEAGTNDALASISQAAFAANITTGINTCKAAGVPCVVLTVAPTYGASFGTATILGFINSYNAWINANVPGLGATVADIYTALVDTPGPTGQMQSQYSVGADGVTAGDGVHPGPLGHYRIGVVVGAAQIAAMAGMSQIYNWALNNLHPNPLNTGTGSVPDSGVYVFAQDSVTSIDNDTSGFLTAGRWAQMDITSATSGGAFQEPLFPIDPSTWSVGDVMAFGCQVQIQDVTSNFIAENFNASFLSYCNVGFFPNGALAGGGPFVLGPNVGPSLLVQAVPSGSTSLYVGAQIKTKQGVHTKIRVGNYAVYNLTRLGLAGIIT